MYRRTEGEGFIDLLPISQIIMFILVNSELHAPVSTQVVCILCSEVFNSKEVESEN